MVKRMVTRVYLAFDGDSAGMKATVRSLELAENEGLDVRVIELPPGKDPDALVREDLSAWMKVKNGALPVLEYQLTRIYADHDITASLGKGNAAKAVISLLARLDSNVSRMYYLEKAAKILSVPVTTLTQEAARLGISASSSAKGASVPASPGAIDATEIGILRLVVAFPHLRQKLAETEAEWFASETARDLRARLCLSSPADFQSNDFYATLPNTQQEVLAGALFSWQDEGDDDPDASYTMLARRLEAKFLRRELNRLRDAVQQAEQNDEATALSQLLARQQELLSRLSDLDPSTDAKES
jgi:DNA primase